MKFSPGPRDLDNGFKTHVDAAPFAETNETFYSNVESHQHGAKHRLFVFNIDFFRETRRGNKHRGSALDPKRPLSKSRNPTYLTFYENYPF